MLFGGVTKQRYACGRTAVGFLANATGYGFMGEICRSGGL